MMYRKAARSETLHESWRCGQARRWGRVSGRGGRNMNANERPLVEQPGDAKERGRKLLEVMVREATERLRNQPLPPLKRRTIHYTELADLPADDPLSCEWNAYRRALPRLLAEGNEGKFILMKGEDIIGLYETWDAAHEVGLKAYFGQEFLVHQILTEEPLLQISPY